MESAVVAMYDQDAFREMLLLQANGLPRFR
jgi:hypothetical protein